MYGSLIDSERSLMGIHKDGVLKCCLMQALTEHDVWMSELDFKDLVQFLCVSCRT